MLVFCSGMKRSGSTWQFNAVCRLLERRRTVVVEGFFPDDELEMKYDDLIEWAKEPDTIHVVKTHALFDSREKGLDPSSVWTTYTFRDIRDAAVSIKRQFGAEGQRLIDILDESVATYYRAVQLPNSLSQRYESFTTDPQQGVVDLAAFFGLDLNSAEIDAVVSACSVERLKKVSDQEASNLKKRLFHGIWHFNRKFPVKRWYLKLGLPLSFWVGLRNRVRPYDNKTLLRPGHISSSEGSRGGWKDQLSASEIALIDERYGDWLRETRYE